MDFSDILPIGTVCRLKGAKKKIMIIGYEKNNKKKSMQFNYIGCQFPEGITSKKGQLYFLYDKIDQIYFMGYNEQLNNISRQKSAKKPLEKEAQEKPSNDKVEEQDIIFDENDEQNNKINEQVVDSKSKEIFDSIPTQ